MQDWRVLRRRHTFALLASLYQSSTDAHFRRAVLQVSSFTASRRADMQSLLAMTACPSACRNLVQREGFIAFLSQQWELSSGSAASEARATYLELLENVVIALGAQEATSLAAGKESKKSKTSWKEQTLALLRRVLEEAGEFLGRQMTSSFQISPCLQRSRGSTRGCPICLSRPIHLRFSAQSTAASAS